MGKRICWTIFLVLLVLPLSAGEEKPLLKKQQRQKPRLWPKQDRVRSRFPRRRRRRSTPPSAAAWSSCCKRQNKNGSWGSAEINRPGDVYAPVPGAHQAFRAAVTSLCISALIETGGDRPGVSQALDRAEAWLFQNLPRVRRATPDAFYNIWTHAYSIQALVRMLGRKPDDAERAKKIRELIRQQIEMLDRYEVVDGGWAYYDFKAAYEKTRRIFDQFCNGGGTGRLGGGQKCR